MAAAVLKRLVRDLTPPVLFRAMRPQSSAVVTPACPQYGFFGDYASFAEAAAEVTGYDVIPVAAVASASLAEFVRGFSLPSHIDSRIQQMHSIFAMIARGKQRLRVLDVGGAAGVYYFYLTLLMPEVALDWTVLELPSVADACRVIGSSIKYLSDVRQTEGSYDVALASGSLQYFEKPFDGINLCLTKGRHVILSRMPIQGGDRDIIKVQRVPPHLHDASMPVWFFSEEKLLSFIRSKAAIELTWSVAADESFWAQGGASAMRGYLIRPTSDS